MTTETAKHFTVQAVLADMGYSSRGNNALGTELESDVRMPFKPNTRPPVGAGPEWSKNLSLFLSEGAWFKSEYHLRSNVETTNGAVECPSRRSCAAGVSKPR